MKLNAMLAEHKISEENKAQYLDMLKKLHDSIESDAEFVLNGNTFWTALHRLKNDVKLLNTYAQPSNYLQIQADKAKQKAEAHKAETELIKSKREGDKSLAKTGESFASFKTAQKKLGRITEPGLSQLKKQFIATTSANVELLMPNGAVYRLSILELSRNPDDNNKNITGRLNFSKLAHYANQLRDTNSAERLSYGPMAKSIDKLLNAGMKMDWKKEEGRGVGYDEWPELGRLWKLGESYKLRFDDYRSSHEEYSTHGIQFMLGGISFSPSGSLVFYNGENELSFTVEQILETRRILEIIKDVRAVKPGTNNRYKYGEYGSVTLSPRRGEGLHPVGTEYVGATLRLSDPSGGSKYVPFDSSEIYGEGDLIRLLMRDD